IYPTGGHGWGFRDNFTYKRQWTGELEKWLREVIEL
ncbi:alpha/beta hydrolase, partial [Bacteroides sp. OttesenSCG-928-D19]|nr:alpha/beta hydrolase [Bacteroides sp. OttesenSCG-928-D19]